MNGKKYIEEYGEPLTHKIKTPSGGYHYYFKRTSDDDNKNELVFKYLTTKTKYRGVGIDIRNNGGYVVAPPSIINNVSYEIINNVELIEVPNALLEWLLLSKNTKASIRAKEEPILKVTQPDYIYDISDEDILKILKLLPKTYLNDYSDWFSNYCNEKFK